MHNIQVQLAFTSQRKIASNTVLLEFIFLISYSVQYLNDTDFADSLLCFVASVGLSDTALISDKQSSVFKIVLQATVILVQCIIQLKIYSTQVYKSNLFVTQ